MSSILPHRVMCVRVCSCFFCAIQLFSHAYFCCNITEFAVETFICWSVLTVQLETLPATASLPNNMPMPCSVHSVWWMGIDYYYLNAHRCKYSRASKSSFREANGNWHFLSVIVHVCNILYSLRNETKSNTMSPYGRNSFTPL